MADKLQLYVSKLEYIQIKWRRKFICYINFCRDHHITFHKKMFILDFYLNASTHNRLIGQKLTSLNQICPQALGYAYPNMIMKYICPHKDIKIVPVPAKQNKSIWMKNTHIDWDPSISTMHTRANDMPYFRSICKTHRKLRPVPINILLVVLPYILSGRYWGTWLNFIKSEKKTLWKYIYSVSYKVIRCAITDQRRNIYFTSLNVHESIRIRCSHYYWHGCYG